MKTHKSSKLVTVLLAILMSTALFVPASLAAVDSSQQYAFKLSQSPPGGSEVQVKSGETFTVELTLSRTDTAGADMEIIALQDELQYSTEYLRADSVETVAEGITDGGRDMSNGIDRKILIMLNSRTNSSATGFVPFEYSPGEVLARVTFTAMKDGVTEILQVSHKIIKSGTDSYLSTSNNVAVTIGTGTPPAQQYKITVTNPANGIINTSPSVSAAAGERVDLSITLAGGYTFSRWNVTGAAVENYGSVQGAYFIMPGGDVTVTANLNAPQLPVDPPSLENPGGGGGDGGGGSTTSPQIRIEDDETPLTAPDTVRFDDVPKTYWANARVEYLAALGFVTGKTANLFYPSDTITRAEFVTILARMSGENLPEFDGKFSDVKAGAYYAGPVAWAIKSGVTIGTSETTFSPDAPIQRQQIATMIARYAAYKGYGFGIVNDAIDFTDKASIADYASAAVTAMQRANIINGYPDGSFKPVGSTTRAEAAKMLALVHDAMFPGLYNPAA